MVKLQEVYGIKNLVIIQYISGADPETLKVVGVHRSLEKFMEE